MYINISILMNCVSESLQYIYMKKTIPDLKYLHTERILYIQSFVGQYQR